MKKLYLLFLFLVFLGDLHAQTFPFKRISIEEGLSQSVVQDMVQAEDGSIWMATEYGINRFDGKTIQSFYTKDGLPSNGITALYLDDNQSLWIGTDRGLAVYVNGIFSVFEGTDSLLKHPINQIKVDDKNRVWLATEGHGLWMYDGDNFDIWNRDNGLSSDSIRAFAIDEIGNLWIGTRQGAVKFNGNRFSNFTTENGLADNKVRSLIIDRYGIVWIGTRNGLSRIANDGTIKNWRESNGLIYNRITRLFKDSRNRLWIATENGASIFDDGKFFDLSPENGLETAYVMSIIEDSEQSIWMGTYGSGALQYQGDHFKNWTIEDGLPNSVVSAIHMDKKQKVWIGTFGGGLAKLSMGGKIEQIFTEESSRLFDNRIYHLAENEKNELWVATRHGINIISANGRMRASRVFPREKYRYIYFKGDARIWTATEDNGLIIYENGDINFFTTESGLVSNSTRVIFEASDKTMYVGTTNGLSIINQDKSVKNLTTSSELISPVIMDIEETEDGSIWLAHFLGLSRLKQDGTIQHFPIDFRGEPVACYFLVDHDGFLWVGTNKGLMRFNKNDPTAIPKWFTSKMGLLNDELNKGAIFIDDENDLLWLGTIRGLSVFDHKTEMANSLPNPIRIDEVEAMGKITGMQKQVELKFDDNYFQVEFSSISHLDPKTVNYRYRLINAEDDWQYTYSNKARYAGLTDGEYTFQVAAVNPDGLLSEPVSINLKVKAPYWKTWWFISLILIVFSIVSYLIYKTLEANRQIEVERMRVRIASDLHDDVGASLTEMALQTDFIQSYKLDPDVKDMMHQLGEMSRYVVTTMDDIVWSIDARNDTLGDLTDRIQDYALQVLTKVNIQPLFEFHELPTDKTLHADTRQHIYLIVKEAINNAIKYANATSIELKFKQKGNKLNLSIHDNGVGFIGSEKKTGHGIRNMENRAKKLGAHFSIEARNGTLIQINGIQI